MSAAYYNSFSCWRMLILLAASFLLLPSLASSFLLDVGVPIRPSSTTPCVGGSAFQKKKKDARHQFQQVLSKGPRRTLLQSSSSTSSFRSSSSSSLSMSSSFSSDSLDAMVHRKEYELRTIKSQHSSTTDPVQMALSYAQESATSPLRLARALRRVHDEPIGGNIDGNHNEESSSSSASQSTNRQRRKEQLAEIGMTELGMRRASFVVDIKRKSHGQTHCTFDDAGLVAEAMVRLGADAVLINTDFVSYGGDLTELKSAVKAVRKVSSTAAVVMKDIVVDEIQLGLAKEAGADAVLLMACVLGPALGNFLDLATTMGLETIVECHTRNEIQVALDLMAQNILVNNYDRIGQQYHPQQALKLAGLFPGSGGPIICLATGGIATTDQMKRHLVAGYDGVVIGQACMGSPKAPEFIRAVRDRTLLPAELAPWGLDAEFDLDGNLMPGPKRNVPQEGDADVYQ